MTCISNLTTLVERSKNAPIPLFLATDFGDYGSLSKRAIITRGNADSLMKVLAPLKPIIFQPSTYNLTEHGAVAIVEMNIVASGRRLFVVGGGSFQWWLVDIFLNKTNTDQKKEDEKKNAKINCVTCCVVYNSGSVKVKVDLSDGTLPLPLCTRNPLS